MKNYTTSIIVSIFMLISSIMLAQDFQGVATYKTSMKMDFKMDSISTAQGINKEMKEQLNAMLQKQFQKEYSLTFTPSESVYKQEEKLAAPTPQGNNGFQVMVMGDGASTELYKNTKEKRYAHAQEILGKKFLVQDALENKEWKLENETKFIGQYTCYKATRTIEMKKMTSMSVGSNDEEPEVTTEKVTVTAWYTPEIPVNSGPDMYWGLPGLILEVNDGTRTIVCSKIVMNPKDKVAIKEPTSGKKVNSKEFQEIMDKKSKEMMERYRSNRRGDGNEIRIEIGG
ncbi:GLPGLI family protein [Kordia periserrulae]|uniref:GLPGLI family protein n=1 Tax=Kordia periserrulae TaxID=701523 RepID=A0A2T6C5T9_9FLAO|nr:GLPGLI family protein [Kordia periserrulae]PTX63699.1 GLPGLI family protein [Kordia periserrulae]